MSVLIGGFFLGVSAAGFERGLSQADVFLHVYMLLRRRGLFRLSWRFGTDRGLVDASYFWAWGFGSPLP